MLVGTNNQLNRDRWLEETLKKIPSNSRALNGDAGELKYKSLCKHLNYVGQDFAQYDRKGDKKGLQTGSWVQSNLDNISNITSIPEANESFDAVMCIEVFEHLPEPMEAIKEFSRLLRPGGHLILTASFCSLHTLLHIIFTLSLMNIFLKKTCQIMDSKFLIFRKMVIF